MPRFVGVLGPAALVVFALAATVAALLVGGGADAPLIIDPGPVVRWGLPIAKLVFNLGVAATLGSLVLAVFALSSSKPEFDRALDVAAAGAAVWTVAAAASAFFSFTTVFNTAPSLDERYGEALGTFLTEIELGQAWLVTMLVGAALTVLCFAVRNVTALGIITAATAIGLAPLAEQGHAGGAADHNLAVTALWLHLIFAAVWVGGLLLLVVLRATSGPERLAAILPRYSTLALVSFLVVAASGYVSAAIRVGSLPELLTPYGLLVIAKVAALVVLGLLGALQRRVLVGRVLAGSGHRMFAVFVAVELAFMGVASGVAAALARTAPPVVEIPAADLADPTPAEYLTGSPLPPELTPIRYLTTWDLDLLWALVVGFGLFFYLAAVERLRRRGDRWPWYRAAFWVIGMLTLFWSTSGSLGAYQEYLFSIHMLEHMLLTMVIPIFLVLSAPVTLALRTIRKRDDGSRGPREWILVLVHSGFSKVLTNPIVAAVLFAASLWVFYYSPLFRWATEQHAGHIWMVAHFLITGYLFAQVLIGVDPIGGRPPYALRLLLLLATMAFHAFFGLAIMSQQALFLADWYGAMGRTWGLPPLEDQVWGGGIAWSVGEIPTVALAIIVAIMWARSDDREATRRDRAADRDGDAELAAYNAALAERASRSAR
ncbi:cytochrome c oxidase assembly protein [uncultured Schumannella sp.]|uniref:cytochrome c oxidase assembly protein n=1 Tax=uncultured Schumannella sp. TaxID=1195956 RepID=UPI0025D955AC|nr:cytochrome c oxidase assembly protein [uncultured Schumannella sp.]